MPTIDDQRETEVWQEWQGRDCPRCHNKELEVSFTAAYGTTYVQVLCYDCGWFVEYDIHDNPAEEQQVRY